MNGANLTTVKKHLEKIASEHWRNTGGTLEMQLFIVTQFNARKILKGFVTCCVIEETKYIEISMVCFWANEKTIYF